MTRKKNTPQTIELLIQGLTAKGNGIGTYHHPAGVAWKVEVPFAIPGDLVRATIYKRSRTTNLASLEEVITPSPQRQLPRCAHFGVCGGCRWQQMPYAEQLRIKEEAVRLAFTDIAIGEGNIRPILPCSEQWEYRNKMEFTFSQNLQGDRFLGLMMEGGRGRVLNIAECHLVHPWFMTALEAVRLWWADSGLKAYHPYKDTGSLRVLTVREGMRTGGRLVMLTVSGNADYALSKEQIAAFTAAISGALESDPAAPQVSIFLRIQQAVKGKATQFYEMHLHGPDHIEETLRVGPVPTAGAPLTFQVSPSAFFQPNTAQAEAFYSMAIQLARPSKEAVVYDLYCGTGTIGLSVASQVKQVVGIELSAEAALDARTNAAANGIGNYTVLCGDMREVLKAIFEEKSVPPPDILMVDPPRVGLDAAALEYVLAFGAPHIVYISCNPKSQADNIRAMVAGGYCVEAVQPVDQFPHTVHIENIVLLTRCRK